MVKRPKGRNRILWRQADILETIELISIVE